PMMAARKAARCSHSTGSVSANSPIARCATDERTSLRSGTRARGDAQLQAILVESRRTSRPGGFPPPVAGGVSRGRVDVRRSVRRQFLKLMGASLLLSGLTACNETRSEHALPYVNQPEHVTPGVPRHYATAVLFEGYAQPVIATTYAGRPTKLDGNPDHPVTRGASDIFMQSAIFALYDPERSKVPIYNGTPCTWSVFACQLSALRVQWSERQGEGLRI